MENNLKVPPYFLFDFSSGIPVFEIDPSLGHFRNSDGVIVFEGHVFSVPGHFPNAKGKNKDEVARELYAFFKAHGISGFSKIAGDFCCAMLELNENAKCTVFRSLGSQYQIYFNDNSFSSRLLPLVACENTTPTLNWEYTSRFLSVVPSLQHTFSFSPCQNVNRLPPGFVLEKDRGGAFKTTQVDHRTYQFIHRPQQRPEDVAPEISRLVQQAVIDRVYASGTNEVFCEMSGGLDSSFIASVLGKAGIKTNGYLFSYPDQPTGSLSEKCAQTISDTYSIPLQIIAPEDYCHVDLSSEQPYADEPVSAFAQMAALGHKIHSIVPPRTPVFSGHSADQLFLGVPQCLPFLIKRGEWRAALHSIHHLSKRTDRSAFNLLLQALMALLPKEILLKLQKTFGAIGGHFFTVEDLQIDLSFMEPIDWLHDNRALTFQNEASVVDHKIFGTPLQTLLGDFGFFTDIHFVLGPWLELAGRPYMTPFCDLRLIDYLNCEVSWHLINDWSNPYKHLLREAQKGIVPEFVRNRKRDGVSLAGIQNLVLKQNMEPLRQLIRESDKEIPGRVERNKLEMAFEKMCFGAMDSSSGKVSSLIGLLLWWRDFKIKVERHKVQKGLC